MKYSYTGIIEGRENKMIYVVIVLLLAYLLELIIKGVRL